MINSMTGFASAAGPSAGGQWTWEIKTVNAKGLDVRLRVPPGFDALEQESRRAIGARLARGTCHATLTIHREAEPARVAINVDVLQALVDALRRVALPPTLRPASLDGLLAIRGVVEHREPAPDEAGAAALRAACLRGLDAALDSLAGMRAREGEALRSILDERLDTVARLAQAADQAPQRQPEAVQDKLAQTIAALAGTVRARSRPPAPGGADPRGEGRRAGGTGPARDACRRGAQAPRGRGRRRPPARLPGAGTRARGQYVLCQGE